MIMSCLTPNVRSPSARSLSACIAALLAGSAPAISFAQDSAAAASLNPGTSLGRISANLTARAARPATHAVAPSLAAASVIVTSCEDDGGFDTLRHAVLVANEGDTVDMSGLACSKITLQSGAILVGLDNLTIVGPGAPRLTIDGADMDRVFNHSGAGTLMLTDMTIAHGTIAADKAYGGCIYSKGSVRLDRSTVDSCSAHGQTIGAGGGVVALKSATFVASRLTGNVAFVDVGTSGTTSAAAGAALGSLQLLLVESVVSGNSVHAPTGKVYAGGVVATSLTMKYSTVTGNTASTVGTPPDISVGGGVVAGDNTTILFSTIDHNVADAAGGLFIQGSSMHTTSITQSTISSNIGTLAIGALSTTSDISIANSTIAFNTSGTLGNIAVVFNSTAKVQSSIIADNSPVDADGGGAIGGANNIIKIVGSGITVPAGTITLDPNLQPLALNGGITRTHALGSGSPAIDAGTAGLYTTDQRGPTYRRVVGEAADIGAVEADADHIFGMAFEFPLAN